MVCCSINKCHSRRKKDQGTADACREGHACSRRKHQRSKTTWRQDKKTCTQKTIEVVRFSFLFHFSFCNKLYFWERKKGVGGGDFACAGSKIWVIRPSMGNAYTSTRNQPRLCFCSVLFCSVVICIVHNTQYAIERKRGGAWTCAGQIEAIGISVNAYPHQKSSPLAFFRWKWPTQARCELT